MADSQVEGWLKLGKLQEQVTEKYPNVQVLGFLISPNLLPNLIQAVSFTFFSYSSLTTATRKLFPDTSFHGSSNCRRQSGHLGLKIQQTGCFKFDFLAKEI